MGERIEVCNGIRRILLLAKLKGETFPQELRDFLKYHPKTAPPPLPDNNNNNYHDKKANKKRKSVDKRSRKRRRIIESSDDDTDSQDSDSNFIVDDSVIEFDNDSDSSGELRYDESQSESEIESSEEYTNDIIETEYVLDDKNFCINGMNGSDVLSIFIALQDYCSWRRIDKYTFKLGEDEIFSIQCDPTPEQRGKSKLYFSRQVLSWTKIAPSLYTSADDNASLPESFLQFLQEPIAETPQEDNYVWNLHIFLRILLEISRRVEGETYPMKRWEVINGVVLAFIEWSSDFDITRLFRHVETTRLDDEFDERRRFYDSLVQHDLKKSTRNLITTSYMEYNSCIGKNRFVKLDGMSGKHLVSYFITLNDETRQRRETKTFVLGGEDIFKFTIYYDESNTLHYVGESDGNFNANEALFADMWLARFGEFLQTPIPVTFKQSGTALFVALFAMAYKTACVIDEWTVDGTMDISSTCNAVYSAIDQFCSNFFIHSLVDELVDGDVTNLTELEEGRGNVLHYK